MRNRSEFVQLVDRYRLGRAQRLSIGVSISDDFRMLHSTLMLATGRGKFLKARWFENLASRVPDEIADACQECQSEHVTVQDFSRLRIDLSRFIAGTVNQLAARSGVHSKLLMACCVSEPGVWVEDYDGQQSWQPFLEPEQLAELAGLTVIDSLLARDLAAGGRGGPIDPLAHWLLFADRNETISEHPRMLLNLGRFLELTWLPESDGLDEELPALRFRRVLGLEIENLVIQAFGKNPMSPSQRDESGAQGQTHETLLRLLQEFEASQDLGRKLCGRQELQDLAKQLVDVAIEQGLDIRDILKTLATCAAKSIEQFLDRFSRKAIQLIAGGELRQHGLLLSELSNRADVEFLEGDDRNYVAEFANANVAALLGLMHIDQMPMTVPWLTGTEIPRVLGRITSGSPANWRRVIMEMGDCRPPVMSLREAV